MNENKINKPRVLRKLAVEFCDDVFNECGREECEFSSGEFDSCPLAKLTNGIISILVSEAEKK